MLDGTDWGDEEDYLGEKTISDLCTNIILSSADSTLQGLDP